MSLYCLPTQSLKARKSHACTWCGESVLPGDEYKRYRFFFSRDAGTVKAHPECYEAIQDEAREWGYDYEFSPYSNQRPQRKQADE